MLTLEDITDPLLKRIAQDDPTAVDELAATRRLLSMFWIKDISHTPLSLAAHFRSINILNYMLQKNENGTYKFPAVVQNITTMNNYAFNQAAMNGHQHVINRLLQKNEDGTYEFPSLAKNSEALIQSSHQAAKNGHLAVVNRLLQKNEHGTYEFPEVAQNIAGMGNFAFQMAAINGHLDVVNRLLQKNEDGTYEFPEVAQNIAGMRNFAFRMAAINGHLDVVNRLLQKNEDGTYEFPEVAQNAAADNKEAFPKAVNNGHLGIVNRLLQKNEDGTYEFPEVAQNIAAGNNSTLRSAAEKGHLGIVNRLLQKNEDGTYDFPEVARNIATLDNKALYTAVLHRRHNVVNRLLTFKDVFTYAEMHIEEYGQHFVNPFVATYLQTLAEKRAAFEAAQPNGVFDLSADDADYVYYVLRNLIRRGESLDSINALLSIPAVNNLAARDENELLKLAIRLGQNGAAARLLAHPQVLAYAQQNNFYAQEMQSGVDLRQLAQNTESSMVALSGPEKERVENLKKRYQSVVDEMGGTAQVIVDYKTYLQQSYQAAPAQVTLNNLKIDLPFEWGSLEALRNESRWTHAQYRRVLEAYYKHDAHTAYRYLSKPNHWMAPNASYVYVDEEDNSKRYASFESYLPTIALYWVAAKDENEPEQEDVTHVERMQLFTKQLAYVNRQHNWDKKDKDGKEYNDLEGDKPSCYSGVTRNLFISLHKHSVMQTQSFVTVPELTEAVRGCIVGFYKSHFQNLDTGTIEGLEKAVMSYFIDAERLPNIPNIPQDEIDALKLELNIKYAGKQVQGFQSISDYVDKTFDASNVGDSHFMKFYQTFSLDVMLQTRSWQRP